MRVRDISGHWRPTLLQAFEPMNPISNMASSADSQSASAKVGMDMSGAKDLAVKKTDAKDKSASSVDDSQTPQMFDQVLSAATAVQKPELKPAVSKVKTALADAKDSSKTEAAASPDIALLMSLLPALPQNNAALTTDVQLSASTGADAAIATTAIAPAVTARATAAITTANNLPNTQTTLSDVLNTAAPITVNVASSDSADASSIPEGLTTDKSDLFASLIAKMELPAPSSAVVLSTPTQQTPTITAVAQALPVTAPGALDELPVTHAEWPAALGHRLLWAVGEGMQKVEISVHPQDMGPINVHIRIENDKTDIRFTALHSLTRDALEASIPRLRDMFSQQGLNLSQAQVFSQTPQDSKGRQPDANQTYPGAPGADVADAQEPEQARPMHWRRGLVDDYA